jgi:hypothetical protein
VTRSAERMPKPAGWPLKSRVAIAAIGAALVAGCGGDESKRDQGQVRAAFAASASALVQGDYEKACSLMTRRARAHYAETARALERARRRERGGQRGPRTVDCPQTLRVVYGNGRSQRATRAVKTLRVRSVRIRGADAVVTTNQSTTPALMSKVNG